MRTSVLLLLVGTCACAAWSDVVWPDFRGPNQDGHADATALPLTWSETQHIRWKTPIPGRGWSSPVVWGDRIWMTTAPEDGGTLSAVCVSLSSGQVLHDIKVFDNDDPPQISPTNSYASCSPVIEQGRVYVHFGTFGTACLDTETGDKLWERRDLNCDHEEGPGSSPVLFGDLLIIPMDGADVQYLVALDTQTGRTVWKTDRATEYPPENDYRIAFGTPLIVDIGGAPQLISTGSKAVMAYDPATGRERWQVRYAGWSNSSRPIAGNGLAFINTGFQEPELWAVRTDGHGDVTDSHVVWKYKERVPTIPSPLLIDGLIYFVANDAYATCLDAATGQVVWQERIGGKYWASPVYALGRIYFFDDKGQTTVIEAGRTLKVLAVNELDDGFMASPAIIAQSLIVRTKKHLYRIEE